ncbi:hypothetical protein BCR41DRAFT_362516 [Lobosporangium transversale]|uniref:F-box domain-containing protein n=1 Tax=Lobosporangium transversale TaxID=64571 RepID=A0A1Y2G9B0_9FUNG|nr:hypothetical protein BCR41DRAFT_362516 [Lobosporangium transversale]ORZ04690.1 hypothetical protein BCR41DRAFT_362516 [Lobosporangium transversale]|eukprot:XP_021876687.1 hypothetical protein BCR41DRAFT_362516 [Lobosporangium transversale]
MMGNPDLHPLDIPEIISLVGEHLDEKSLFCCIRVSKTFHDTLVKAIWKKTKINSPSRYPTAEALQTYKEYIEELGFYYNFPEEFGSLQGCKNLKHIEYYGGSPPLNPTARSDLSNLIKAHSSTITKLTFYCPTLREIWKALLGCTRLETLMIQEIVILKDEVDLFFQACKKVRILTISRVNISRLPSDFLNDATDTFTFPNLSTLHLHKVKIVNPPHPHTSPYCLAMLTRRCPGLYTLSFNGHGDDDRTSPNVFYKTALLHRPYALKNLSDLHFSKMDLKDEDMAALLRLMTELRQLVAPHCEFGPLSIRELLANEQEMLDDGQIVRKAREQRLCDAVEVLEINTESHISGGAVQAVLSNCPRLKKLVGSKIRVTEIVDGAEWVSTELTILSIRLEADVDQETAEGMQKQRIAFKQLGKLTRLNYLDLTEQTSLSQKIRTLDLRLRAGLDELVNLKRLRSLSFQGDNHQQMQSEDALWVINNWPDVEFYGDIAAQDPDTEELVDSIFEKRGIVPGLKGGAWASFSKNNC